MPHQTPTTLFLLSSTALHQTHAISSQHPQLESYPFQHHDRWDQLFNQSKPSNTPKFQDDLTENAQRNDYDAVCDADWSDIDAANDLYCVSTEQLLASHEHTVSGVVHNYRPLTMFSFTPNSKSTQNGNKKTSKSATTTRTQNTTKLLWQCSPIDPSTTKNRYSVFGTCVPDHKNDNKLTNNEPISTDILSEFKSFVSATLLNEICEQECVEASLKCFGDAHSNGTTPQQQVDVTAEYEANLALAEEGCDQGHSDCVAECMFTIFFDFFVLFCHVIILNRITDTHCLHHKIEIVSNILTQFPHTHSRCSFITHTSAKKLKKYRPRPHQPMGNVHSLFQPSCLRALTNRFDYL